MASLTITVPDGYVPRIREAFGKSGQPASVADLQKAIKSYIRSRTLQYESAKASTEKYDVIAKEVW